MRIIVVALALACAGPVYAKLPAKPAPLPDHVEEADYQRMQACIARVQAAEAILRVAQLELDKARGTYAAELGKVQAQYKITDADHVADVGTHAITRAK